MRMSDGMSPERTPRRLTLTPRVCEWGQDTSGAND
jgi:hypothetical protein